MHVTIGRRRAKSCVGVHVASGAAMSSAASSSSEPSAQLVKAKHKTKAKRPALPEYLCIELTDDTAIGQPHELMGSCGLSPAESRLLGVYELSPELTEEGSPVWKNVLKPWQLLVLHKSDIAWFCIDATEPDLQQKHVVMMLKGSVLPHLSLETWEMGLFGNGKFTKRRYVAGIKCRALAALPPPPAFVHIEGGEEITDQRGNFVGYYALAKEATHSVRAVASVKGGSVKLTLWTSRSEQPRLVNGSPVWRHVAKRSLFLARAEPPFFSWMVQTESDVGTARGLVYHDNTGCLSPDGCSDGHWKYAVTGGGWRRGPWRCSASAALPDPPEIILLDADSVSSMTAAGAKSDGHLGYHRLEREVLIHVVLGQPSGGHPLDS